MNNAGYPRDAPMQGIVVMPMRTIGTLLTRLMTLHETTTVEEMGNTLRFI